MYCTTDHVSSYLIRRQIQLIYVGIGMLCRAYRILMKTEHPPLLHNHQINQDMYKLKSEVCSTQYLKFSLHIRIKVLI